MQLTPSTGPCSAVNAVVPVSLAPPMYAAAPPLLPAARPQAQAPATAIAAGPTAAYQPIIYWYPSPPVSPQTAPYYIQTTLPTTVLMKGLPPNIQMHDVLSFLDGLVEVLTHALVAVVIMMTENTELQDKFQGISHISGFCFSLAIVLN